MPSKKKKKKATQTTPNLTTEEKQQLQSYLKDLGQLDLNHISQQFSGPHFAQAFIEGLPTDDPQNLDIILAVGQFFHQKNVQKSVKKSLYKFKSRGIPIPDYQTGDESPVLQMNREESDPIACLSTIAGDGTRAVIIVLPKMPLGMDLGLGIINDEDGIIEFFSGRFGKKRTNEIKDSFAQSFEPLIEVSLDHAATVLENAYRRKEASPNEATQNYLQIRPQLMEKITQQEKSPIFDYISSETLSIESLTDSQVEKLFNHELMESWIIDPEALKPVIEEIVKTDESRILVTDSQKSERIEEIKEKALITLFDDDKKDRIKKRLEEMAFIFYKLDSEDYASLSLTAALSLEDQDSLFYSSPFLKTYLERSLDYYLHEQEEDNESNFKDDESSSNIIIP
jgi:hypothetical protein